MSAKPGEEELPEQKVPEPGEHGEEELPEQKVPEPGEHEARRGGAAGAEGPGAR